MSRSATIRTVPLQRRTPAVAARAAAVTRVDGAADAAESVLKNPQIGEVDLKVKVDAKGMTREISTEDDLKIVETYSLSADGKQLTVTMKASQPVMKIEDAKIKRVYDRQ